MHLETDDENYCMQSVQQIIALVGTNVVCQHIQFNYNLKTPWNCEYFI